MPMQDFVKQAMRDLEKTIASQDRQLKAFRMVIAADNRKMEALKTIMKEYATEDYPGTERLNILIMECLRKHNGAATFSHIATCIEDHQITLPRNKLSILLTKNPQLEYSKNEKIWRLKEI